VTYDDWMKRHGVTFGFQPAEVAMMASWCDHFARWGYAPGELAAASEWLAANGAPDYRPNHFGALRVAVQAAREPGPPAAVDDRLGTCPLCTGAGRLVVPAAGMRTAAGNLIRRGTVAALCRCPLGRWYASCSTAKRGGRTQTMMSLDEYERLRPGWLDEVNEEREAQRLSAEAACERLDEGLRKVLDKARAMNRREPGEEG
jgi:hypothetical protein